MRRTQVHGLAQLCSPGRLILAGPGINQVKIATIKAVAGQFQCRHGLPGIMIAAQTAQIRIVQRLYTK